MDNAVTSLTTGGATPQGLGVIVNEAEDLQSDFLALLTTQLANQDPFSPMDNSQMVQQLATFSQLEQLEGLNNKLTQSLQYDQSATNTQMMNLVGMRVTVLGDGVSVRDGDPSRTLVRTPEAGVATAKVYDESGKVVRTIENIRLKPGYTEVEWDGRDTNGNELPDGDYRLELSATRDDGSFLSVAVFQSGIVETLQFDNNFQTLIVNGQAYSPSDVVEVGVPESWLSGGEIDGENDDATDEADDSVDDGSDDGSDGGNDGGGNGDPFDPRTIGNRDDTYSTP